MRAIDSALPINHAASAFFRDIGAHACGHSLSSLCQWEEISTTFIVVKVFSSIVSPPGFYFDRRKIPWTAGKPTRLHLQQCAQMLDRFKMRSMFQSDMP